MARLGCLLTIFSFVWLCGFTILPVLPFTASTPEIDRYLTPLLCEPGETLNRNQSSYSYRPGSISFTMHPECVNSEGQERSVKDRFILLGVGVYLATFLPGLFLFIAGITRATRKMVTQTMSDNGINIRVFSLDDGTIQPGAVQTSTASLTDRLRQLEEARDNGLISDEEYDRLRQEILDSLV